jgi:hypothetical protein
MPQTPHAERHFSGSEVVRDIVTGMSDGLTVPFALAAGLSGIANSTAIVITGGLAEIAAGSIAMGWVVTWRPGAMQNTMPANGRQSSAR